jgi:DNA-damage-inducible protein D
MLTKRSIVPENLPPADDVKKVQRRLDSEGRKVLKDSRKKKK